MKALTLFAETLHKYFWQNADLYIENTAFYG